MIQVNRASDIGTCIGVNYFPRKIGWPPRFWSNFDLKAITLDFERLAAAKINCARVFLSSSQFMTIEGKISESAKIKLQQLIQIASRNNIRIILVGPDDWEGAPRWFQYSVLHEESTISLVKFWTSLGEVLSEAPSVALIDIRNEPRVENFFESTYTRSVWEKWLLSNSHPTINSGDSADLVSRSKHINSEEQLNTSRDIALLNFEFKRAFARTWVEAQVSAIRKASPGIPITIGLDRNSIPLGQAHTLFSGFSFADLAGILDVLQIHFYPYAAGGYWYEDDGALQVNIMHLSAILSYLSKFNKPILVGELGWYGGSAPFFDARARRFATQEMQAEYLTCLRSIISPYGAGVLNWATFDYPEATDVTQSSGLFTNLGAAKVGLRTFLIGASVPATSREPQSMDGLSDDFDIWTNRATSENAPFGKSFAFPQSEYCR